MTMSGTEQRRLQKHKPPLLFQHPNPSRDRVDPARKPLLPYLLPQARIFAQGLKGPRRFQDPPSKDHLRHHRIPRPLCFSRQLSFQLQTKVCLLSTLSPSNPISGPKSPPPSL